ncbi:membrane protein insertase YidC [Massilia sp. W12]|uniref:membrane protein insertase YidC n=1 Tax=Massilia sp. W12 TaxID=3126507 RepID=UPI0030CC8C33
MQTDIKRNILWVVLLTSLFFLWDNWMVANGHTSFFAPPPKPKPPVAASLRNDLPPGAATAAAGAAPGAIPASAPAQAPAPVFKREVISIASDVIKLDVDTEGGQMTRLELLKYRDGIDKNKNQLLFHVNDKNTYVMQSGLTGPAINGLPLPSHKSGFQVRPGERTLAAGRNELQLVLEAEQGGVKLIKTYTLRRGDYKIGVRHEIVNNSGAPATPQLYMQFLHDGNKPPGDTFFMSSYTGPSVYTNEEHFQKLEFSDVENGKAKHAKSSDNGWIALVQHYFVAAFLPPEKIKRDIYTKKVDTNLYSLGYSFNPGVMANNSNYKLDVNLLAGPQETQMLTQTAVGLDRVKDYGILHVFAEPLFWMMELLHKLIGNWGWTIVVLTVIIKMALFPLSAASMRSMAKMKVVTPKMQAINERYKDDPAKKNQAMMELYKSEKINPLGGCLPILIQMPIFLALYWVLHASVEIRNAPWIGWITDLAAPDPWYVLPAIYAVSMYITTKLNPAPADPMQAKMMLWMPLIFSVMFFFFPSGLVLYWVVNNIMSIGQQWVINRQLEGKK